jgi:integrase
MLRNGGKQGHVDDVVLSDEEFEAIQRAHFNRKTDEKARRRAMTSLCSCLDAISAFRKIIGRTPISQATLDDCANFQRVGLTLPNNWRRLPPEKRRPVVYYSQQLRLARQQAGEPDKYDDVPQYSPNNVLRWSRSLQAAFERANRNALKRKCVRGVVANEKLLTENPWTQFTWIEGRKRPIRQFDGVELLSLMDFFKTRLSGVPIAAAAAKVFLWSGCRKSEVAGLTWDSLRVVGNEYHFEIEGKWGIERWFRIPESVYQELLAFRTNSTFVFASYLKQLQNFRTHRACLSTEFRSKRFGCWFYKRIKEWSKTNPKGLAFVHIFRKTTLQHARQGEDIARQIAGDAMVSESVLMTNYVKETDEEMRQRSNRTFRRIQASLSPEIASRYGHIQDARSEMESQLRAATDNKNWAHVIEVAQQLQHQALPQTAD